MGERSAAPFCPSGDAPPSAATSSAAAAAASFNVIRRFLHLAPVRIVAGLLTCLGLPLLALDVSRTILLGSGHWVVAGCWIGATAVLLGTYAAVFHVLEQRRISELSGRSFPGESLRGLAYGAGAVVAALLVLMAGGCYRIEGLQRPEGLAGAIALLAFLATLEEVVFRGILHRIIEGSAGTFLALLVSNTAFAWVHTDNTGASPLGTAVVGLAGIVLGLLFSLAGRLWLPIAFHLGWNLAQMISGAAVSGLDDLAGSAVLRLSQHGKTWLSGGAFGPEGSVVTLVLLVALAAGLHGVLTARRSYTAPPWRRRRAPTDAPDVRLFFLPDGAGAQADPARRKGLRIITPS